MACSSGALAAGSLQRGIALDEPPVGGLELIGGRDEVGARARQPH